MSCVYTFVRYPKTIATRIYAGYAVVLDREAVLAAVRNNETALAHMRSESPFCEREKPDDDEAVWEYAMAHFNECEAYNEMTGAHLMQEAAFGDKIYIFDNPVVLMDREQPEGEVAWVLNIVSFAADHEALQGYLKKLGVTQSVAVRFCVLAT